MSHPVLDSHRRQYQSRAAGIKAQLAQAERAQHATPGLTPQQRARNIGHLRRQAEARLATLRQQYADGRQGALRGIRANLYRLPPKVGADMSWRDALTRVNDITSQDDAMRLWDLAGMVGDDIMRLALAYVAAPNPEEHPPKWPQVIAAWKRSDPNVAETLTQYDDAWTELQDRQVQYQDGRMFDMPAEQPAADSDTLPHLDAAPTPAPAAASDE